MEKAELVHIQFDEESFIFAALAAIDDQMSFLKGMPLDESYPIVKGEKPGHYNLALSFEGENKDLFLRVIDEAGSVVKENSVPIEIMFSAMVNSMDMMAASDPLEFSEDENDFETSLLNFFSDRDGIMQATNEQIEEQTSAFVDLMTDWFEFDEDQVGLINNLYMTIVSNASPILTRRRDEMFRGNFQPSRFTKN